jgi:CHRD domain
VIRAHRNRHPADIVNPVGGLCPKQRLTWARGGRGITTGLVPVPPNTEGAGSFTAQSNVGQGRICWRITVTGLTDVTAAHIHYRTGPKARQIAVPLTLSSPFTPPDKGCVDAPRALVRQILQHPGPLLRERPHDDVSGRGDLGDAEEGDQAVATDTIERHARPGSKAGPRCFLEFFAHGRE